MDVGSTLQLEFVHDFVDRFRLSGSLCRSSFLGFCSDQKGKPQRVASTAASEARPRVYGGVDNIGRNVVTPRADAFVELDRDGFVGLGKRGKSNRGAVFCCAQIGFVIIASDPYGGGHVTIEADEPCIFRLGRACFSGDKPVVG